MQLSLDDLTNLASQRPIGGRHPWDSNDEAQVDGFYRRVCAELERTLPAASRIAWGHYGSGYASFVDAWFYREERDFKTGKGDQHIGLVILLCRLAPCFVFMQGEKWRHATGGSSYLPALDMVDRLDSPAVAALAERAQPVLERHGLARARRAELEAPLPPDLSIPTILSDPPYAVFDALFHWED